MKTETGNNVALAAKFLREGKLVAVPTETVYGLAGNALDPDAVLQIFKTKQRPAFDPLIVHIGSIGEMEKYAMDIPGTAYRLAESIWPGPLTLLLRKKSIIPDLVTSGLDTVGLRVPRHPLTIQLLNSLEFPLAAPSANPFGYISPTTASHVADQLTGKISYILDGGPCHVGIESTIVGFDNDSCLVYRLGGMRLEEIEKIAGSVTVLPSVASDPSAPGMLKSHYAPQKPLYVGDLRQLLQVHRGNGVAVLCFTGKNFEFPPEVTVYALSPEGDLEVSARNLFAALRDFDQSGNRVLLAEKFPDEGLGKAINDRLLRAAHREN